MRGAGGRGQRRGAVAAGASSPAKHERTVHAEDLLVDDGGNGQAVEAVGERLPQLDVVPPLALVVKAVNAVDGRAFVVAAQDEKVFGVLDLVREQQADCRGRDMPLPQRVPKISS